MAESACKWRRRMAPVVVLGRKVLPCCPTALSVQRPPTPAAKQPEQHKHNNRSASHQRLRKIRKKKNHQPTTERKTRQWRLKEDANGCCPLEGFQSQKAANPQGLNPQPGPKSPRSFMVLLAFAANSLAEVAFSKKERKKKKEKKPSTGAQMFPMQQRDTPPPLPPPPRSQRLFETREGSTKFSWR